MDISPRLWDVKTGRASGKSIEAQKINHAVDKIRVDVNRQASALPSTERTYSTGSSRNKRSSETRLALIRKNQEGGKYISISLATKRKPRLMNIFCTFADELKE